jgi:hypothetical protein
MAILGKELNSLHTLVMTDPRVNPLLWYEAIVIMLRCLGSFKVARYLKGFLSSAM